MKKSDSIQRKYQQSFDIEDYQVMTDTGWERVSSISKTVPYQVWKIRTQSGKTLQAADTHIVFNQDMDQIFVKDLSAGSRIVTEDGIQEIKSIQHFRKSQNMYDISINSENHRFYSNGILSHNSTSYSLFVLWYAITNQDKNILICANRLKTAVEILSRIKMAYEMLPVWLKPGIVKFNATQIEFSNGCKISAQATSESSGRGMSINCLSGKETIEMLKDGTVYTMTLAQAYDLYGVEIIRYDENKNITIRI